MQDFWGDIEIFYHPLLLPAMEKSGIRKSKALNREGKSFSSPFRSSSLSVLLHSTRKCVRNTHKIGTRDGQDIMEASGGPLP